MKKKFLLAVTDAGYSGAPIYVNQLSHILSNKFERNIIVSRNGLLLQGEELKFDDKRIFNLADLKSILGAVRVIRRYRPDAVWLNSFKMSLIVRMGLFLAPNVKPHVFYTVHGLSFRPGHTLRNNLIKLFEKLFKRFVDDYIFLTQYDCNKFCETISRDISYHIIPNFSRIGVTKELIDRKEPCRTFIMIARNEPQKDYLTLLKAFSSFSRDKNVKLHCVGRDTIKLHSVVCGLGIENKVILHGESQDVHELLRDADCFVLSSHYEGMPLVILEAMSMGIPVIATNVCGISELVSNTFGILVEPKSVEALEYALQRMFALNINEINLKRRLAHEEHEKKFSMFKFDERIMQLVNSKIHK